MGTLTDLAEQMRQAAAKAPLNSLKNAEAYLEDAAGAEAILADIKKTVYARRLTDETPVDAAVVDGLAGQHKAHSQTAAVMATLKSVLRRKHKDDWERFDNPRNHENKADYDKNKD